MQGVFLERHADEDGALAHRHSLHIDQLFDELVQFLAAKPKLTAEGADGEAALLFEHVTGALQLGDEAHRSSVSISTAMRSAFGAAPISP